MQSLISRASHSVRFLTQILVAAEDKNANLRETSAKLLMVILLQVKTRKQKRDYFEKLSSHVIVEKLLTKGLGDSHGAVRTIHRDAFYLYQDVWPVRAKK